MRGDYFLRLMRERERQRERERERGKNKRWSEKLRHILRDDGW